MVSNSTEKLRRLAIFHNFEKTLPIHRAIERLAFVQADPIRSPARAQDLILRQRVGEYRAGDLELQFEHLNIEEDFLYAYGFMPRRTYELIQPRHGDRLGKFERQLLDFVSELKSAHPRDLEKHFGRKKVVNAWGGFSKHTTEALDRLQHLGHLRVSRREKGIRIYAPALPPSAAVSPQERLSELAMIIAGILTPTLETTLRRLLRVACKGFAPAASVVGTIQGLLKEGRLTRIELDGRSYLAGSTKKIDIEPMEAVRILAPFDPLIWDRERFEHFWGWAYRFEAYTPLSKRVRGYYAMPILWREQIIGWANASQGKEPFKIEFGFTDRRPTDRKFRQELERETAALREFLQPRVSH